jgi:hypothetical protein
MILRTKGWRQTFTDRAIFPLEPRLGDFSIFDIAHGLSMMCRYGGAVRRFYSVAEHSVLVSMHGDPRFARRKLMHDAAEAVLGFDVPSPIKRDPRFAGVLELEAQIESVLWKQFDCEESGDTHEIDTRILHDERAVLLGPPPMPWGVPGEPLGATITALPPEVAEIVFLDRFVQLFPEWPESKEYIARRGR